MRVYQASLCLLYTRKLFEINFMSAKIQNQELKKLTENEYKYGFVTEVESDVVSKGLNEETIEFISHKKKEPVFMLEWRLNAFQKWKKMREPTWGNIKYNVPNYQDISYYAAPKKKLESLDEVDEAVLETFNKLGIPLTEQKMLAGVAVDAVFDSVSVGTTYKKKLSELGIIFCSFSEAVQEHPELIQKYLGKVVPVSDNFFFGIKFSRFHRWFFLLYPTRCSLSHGTLDIFSN